MNHPNYETSLDGLCDDDRLQFLEEEIALVQPFRTWLEARLGQHLLDLEVTTEDDVTYLRVEIDEEFKATRLLESEQPNPLVDEEHDE